MARLDDPRRSQLQFCHNLMISVAVLRYEVFACDFLNCGSFFSTSRTTAETFSSHGLLTGETGTVHDSCDLLSSLSGHIVVSSFVCALSDLRFICVTAFLAQENESPEFHPSW